MIISARPQGLLYQFLQRRLYVFMLLSEPSAATIASGLFVWWFPGNCRAVYHKVFIMPCATSVQVINGVGCFGSRCHEHYFWDHGSLIEKSRKESYEQYRCFEFFNRSKIWRCCRFACQILNPLLHSCMITLTLDIAVLRLCEILQWDLLSDIETACLYSQNCACWCYQPTHFGPIILLDGPEIRKRL